MDEIMPEYGISHAAHAHMIALAEKHYPLQGADATNMCLRFLRTTDTLAEMALLMPRGWKSNVSLKIAHWAPLLAAVFAPVLIGAVARNCVLSEEEVDVVETLTGERVDSAIDSVPVYADSPALYNNHYKGRIYKLLIVCNLRGFVTFVAGPFGGTQYDDTLLSFVNLKGVSRKILGDGHFSGPHVCKSVGRRQLRAAKTSEHQRELLLLAERRAFLRARVEHVFGASGLGRFRRLKDWRHFAPQWLGPMAVVACCALNASMLCEHGTCGKYTDLRLERGKIVEHTSDCNNTLRRHGAHLTPLAKSKKKDSSYRARQPKAKKVVRTAHVGHGKPSEAENTESEDSDAGSEDSTSSDDSDDSTSADEEPPLKVRRK